MWWVLFAAFGALTFAHFAPFPFVLDWTSRGVALWRVPSDRAADVNPASPTIYLTFDDGPNPTATPELLDVLARERVRATFFIIDRHLTAETAPIVRRMFAEGHGVALHSHSRRLMTLSAGELQRTLDEAADRMERLTGSEPCAAFRPHGGGRSRRMLNGLRASGRRMVGWGAFLWDWDWFRKPAADRLVPRIARRAGPGSIVVLHDGHHENPRADRQYTIDTVQALIPALREKGFAFGTICDALAIPKGQLPTSKQLPTTTTHGESGGARREVYLPVSGAEHSCTAQNSPRASSTSFRARRSARLRR